MTPHTLQRRRPYYLLELCPSNPSSSQSSVHPHRSHGHYLDRAGQPSFGRYSIHHHRSTNHCLRSKAGRGKFACRAAWMSAWMSPGDLGQAVCDIPHNAAPLPRIINPDRCMEDDLTYSSYVPESFQPCALWCEFVHVSVKSSRTLNRCQGRLP